MEYTRRGVLGAMGATLVSGLLAGCRGGDATPTAEGRPLLEVEPNYHGWFEDVSNYEGTRDYRGESDVAVDVGVSGDLGYFKFGPPAVAVSTGTTVEWTWTGRGGAHNVVAEQGRFDSGDPIDEDGHTFSHTFDQPAVYRYLCEPHEDLGMRGAVFVALDAQD